MHRPPKWSVGWILHALQYWLDYGLVYV
jgi:hypothetical protein